MWVAIEIPFADGLRVIGHDTFSIGRSPIFDLLWKFRLVPAEAKLNSTSIHRNLCAKSDVQRITVQHTTHYVEESA